MAKVRGLLPVAAMSLCVTLACTTPAQLRGGAAQDAAVIMAAERERLRALVAADMTAAERLHSPEFSVITPRGRLMSRAAYLASIASGESDYLSWEASEIDVRVHGGMAAIRYRARVDIVVRGQRLQMEAWDTGIYERRHGEWAITWFQVTEIGSAPS